jgi:hypothetical protein
LGYEERSSSPEIVRKRFEGITTPEDTTPDPSDTTEMLAHTGRKRKPVKRGKNKRSRKMVKRNGARIKKTPRRGGRKDDADKDNKGGGK